MTVPTTRHTLAPDPAVEHSSSAGRRLLHRWPTALAVVLGALTVADLAIDRSFVQFTATLSLVITLVYVGSAALQRRGAAWPILLAGFPALLLPGTAGRIATFLLLAAIAVTVIVGYRRQRGSGNNDIPPQAVGAAVMATLCLTALAVSSPTTSAYLLVGALLFHATWDAVHHWRHRVVTRSYAEFCVVIDVLLAAGILTAI